MTAEPDPSCSKLANDAQTRDDSAYVKQRLSLLSAHVVVVVAQDEAHGSEEVTLA
jgi:hypothetical protein